MNSNYNIENEKIKKLYEETLLHAEHKDEKTVAAVWRAINQYEKFTEKTDFIKLNKQDVIAFKQWIKLQENNKGLPLSIQTVRSRLAALKQFFSWLAIRSSYIGKIDTTAIDYLRLSDNEERAGRATKEKDVPTLEEVRKVLLSMPTNTAIERRNRAMIAFTALTGIRDGALISLKIKDVDIEKEEIWQDPKHVKTKRRKGITTVFINIDPLWKKIFKSWFKEIIVDLEFSDDAALFPKENIKHNQNLGHLQSSGLSQEHWTNASATRKIFKQAFSNTGLPYHNPHSFRDMIVLWSMEYCSQKEAKAVSQNLGHEHMMTTFNSYGTLSTEEQRRAIHEIGKGSRELSGVPTRDIMDELSRRTNR